MTECLVAPVVRGAHLSFGGHTRRLRRRCDATCETDSEYDRGKRVRDVHGYEPLLRSVRHWARRNFVTVSANCCGI
jgi:hypothetical protein